MVGYTSWLLLPFSGYFLLSFFPEHNPIVVTLAFVCSILEFIITFWTGIILILIVNALLEKQPFDADGVKKYSATLLQPTARVLILHIVLVLVGFVLLVVPGFMALVWFAFAQTAAVLDSKRGMEALTLSRSLCDGRFGRVLYRLVGGPVLIFFVYSIIVSLLLSLAGVTSGFDPTKITPETQLPAWLDLFQSVIEIFTIPLLATYMTLLYKHLRETQEKGGKGGEGEEKKKTAEGEHKTSPLQPNS